MRQIFTSQRLETVEQVAQLLNEAGIETWTSQARSFKGARRMPFSYLQPGTEPQPAVWIVNGGDLPLARALLREAGLVESGRAVGYLQPARPDTQERSSRLAVRLRLALLAMLAALTLLTVARIMGFG